MGTLFTPEPTTGDTGDGNVAPGGRGAPLAVCPVDEPHGLLAASPILGGDIGAPKPRPNPRRGTAPCSAVAGAGVDDDSGTVGSNVPDKPRCGTGVEATEPNEAGFPGGNGAPLMVVNGVLGAKEGSGALTGGMRALGAVDTLAVDSDFANSVAKSTTAWDESADSGALTLASACGMATS